MPRLIAGVPRVGRPVEAGRASGSICASGSSGSSRVDLAASVVRPRCSTCPGMVEPRLQHHRGGDLVDDLAARLGASIPASSMPRSAVDRREALVVRLDRHADHASQAPRPRSMAASRRRSVRAVERQRQADDDQLGLLLAHERGDLVVVVALRPMRWTVVSGDAIVPGDVADGDADPLRAEVDAERAHAWRRAPASGSRVSAASSRRGAAPRRAARGPCRRPWRCRPCRRRRRRPPWPRPGSGRPPDVADPAGDRGDERRRRRSVVSPTSTTTAHAGLLAHGDGQVAQVARRRGRRPGCTTTPSSAMAASSAARPSGQLPAQRLDLVVERLDLVEPALHAAEQVVGRACRPAARRRRSARSSRWSSATLAAPVTASMRRRFEPIDDSLTILIVPMSPVARTCVPPHSSIDGPASSTRTMSPYLSPKNAIAPSASASSLVVSKIARRRVAQRLGVGEPLDLGDLRRR